MLKILIVIVSLLTIFGSGVIASAGLGYRFGLWDLGFAFDILRKGSTVLVGGVLICVVALIAGIVTKNNSAMGLNIVAILLGGGLIAALIFMRGSVGAHPIHDLTTDFQDPPMIRAAPQYVGADNAGGNKTVSQIQRDLYPDLQPLYFKENSEAVFDTALEGVKSMGWGILAEDRSGGIIEAAETTFWFGFVDDVIIRIRAEENGTRVDLRSKSRVGGSDLGANYKRLKKYGDWLKANL